MKYEVRGSYVARVGLNSREESVMFMGGFEGSVIVRLVSKNIVVKSGIRDGYFEFECFFCAFFVRVGVGFMVRVCLMHLCSTARFRVVVRFL